MHFLHHHSNHHHSHHHSSLYYVGLTLPHFALAASINHNKKKGKKSPSALVRVAHLVTKTLPILALAHKLSDATGPAVYIRHGLYLSALGDAFLSLDTTGPVEIDEDGQEKNTSWFLPGLGSFLLAHVSYIHGLSSFTKWQELHSATHDHNHTSKILSVAILLGVFGGSAVLVKKHLLKDIMQSKKNHKLKWPVVAYATAITFMVHRAVTAVRVAEPENKFFAYCGLAGSLLFAASDFILARNKFVAQIPGAEYLVMSTYYLAQLGIAASTCSVASA